MSGKKILNRPFAAGFTLLEAMLASLLIGFAIAALAASSGAFTLNNAAGVDLSTAEFLIEEIRERTATISYSGLPALHNQQYQPPIDVSGAQMPEFSTFAQTITVRYVNPANLIQTTVADNSLVRVSVAVTKNNRLVSSASWIRARL